MAAHAEQIRANYAHQQIIPEHLFLAMLNDDMGPVCHLLKRGKCSTVDLKHRAQKRVTSFEDRKYVRELATDTVFYSSDVRDLLVASQQVARMMKASKIAEVHIFLAMLQQNGSTIKRLCGEHNFTFDKARALLENE